MNCSWVFYILSGLLAYLIILFTGLPYMFEKILPKLNDQQIHIFMICISALFAIFLGTTTGCDIGGGEDYPGEDSYQGRMR